MDPSRRRPNAFILWLSLLAAVPVGGEPATVESADLTVTATATSRQSGAGWHLTWQVAIRNAGPAAAADIVLEIIGDETLVAQIRDLRFAGDGRSGCDGNAMACRVGGLRAGESRRFEIVATLAGNRRSAGLEFRVASSTTDGAPCDNRYYSSTFLD